MPSYPSFLMPTDAVKLRFREPYMSEGNNLKSSGIVPAGIYQGFTPNVGADPNVLILNTDGTRNDSVAVCETYLAPPDVANYNLTIRSTDQLQLDFTGHTVFPCWVVLRPAYSIVAHPFSGTTSAQFVTINTLTINDSVATARHHGDIKICRITGLPLVVGGTVFIVIPTDRDDNGGPLVTQANLAVAAAYAQVAGTYTFPVTTGMPGGWGSFTPAASLILSGFRSNQLVCLSCTGGGYSNIGDDIASLGFDIDGTPTGNLGGAPGDIYSRMHAWLSNNISFSVWATVSAGSHTFELKAAATSSNVIAGSKFIISRF